MSLTQSQQVLVGSTAVRIVTPIASGKQTLISNKDTTNSFFCGGAGVTTASGAEVKPGASLSSAVLDLPPETEIWAVATVANVRADVFEIVGN